MIIDISKELLAKDKIDGTIHTVTSIFFPLGNPSGKDVTVSVGDIDEWRSIEDIELISNVQRT